MRPFRSRDPGIVGVALTRDDVFVQMIVDGHHLADETVRLVWAAAGGRVALVTDATAGAGGGGGSYQLGDVEIEVADGGVRSREDGVLAGTVLTMIDAVRNLHALGIPFEDAVGAATVGACTHPRPSRISACSSRAARRTSSCSTTGSRSSTSSARVRRVSWLETELDEQPAALARLLERQSGAARESPGSSGATTSATS